MSKDFTEEEKLARTQAYVNWQFDTFIYFVKGGVEAGVPLDRLEKSAYVWGLSDEVAEKLVKHAILQIAVKRKEERDSGA